MEVTHTIDAYNSLRFIGLDPLMISVAPETFDAEQQSTIEQVPIIQQQPEPWGCLGYENSRTEMVECNRNKQQSSSKRF